MGFPNAMEEQLAPWADKVVDSALQVLEKKGLVVPQEPVKNQLAARPGITVHGQRTHFSADLARGFLSRYCKCHPFAPPAGFSLSTIAHAHHLVDLEGNLRPITLAEIEQGARLVDALADWRISGSAPGIPQDIPPPLQGLAQLIAGAKNCRSYPTCAPRSDLKAEPYVAECYRVLGLSSSPGVHLVSPLRFEGQEVELALHRCELEPEVAVGVGTMPVLGVSSPASVLGGFVVAMAEVLGGGMIFETIGAPVEKLGLWVNAYPFDMRHGTFVYGSPANVICTLMERELNRRLGIEITAKSFNVTAQHPGPQACAQKGLFTGLMAAHGKRLFSGGGSLSVDEVFSPVQLIYDREIFSYIERVSLMYEESLEESLLLAEEILADDSRSFLEADSTARHFRKIQWDSEVFPARMLAQWEASGRPMEAEAATAEVRRLLNEHSYQLEEDKARALEEIYA
ncbi:MAG: hypothetical protein COZ05_20420, partial [Armatimonadetes bacterium CG_4_10_14_3_um_filter_59_10]